MSMKFGLLIDVDLRKRVTSSNTKPEVVWSRGRHLAIVYDVITPPWVARFGRFTAIWSKSQREEEFQYGGRLFFQTGSSCISATLTKFDLRIDFDLQKGVTSSNTKPEGVLSHRCRHLTCHHYSTAGGPIWTKFSNLMRNSMLITMIWSK